MNKGLLWGYIKPRLSIVVLHISNHYTQGHKNSLSLSLYRSLVKYQQVNATLTINVYSFNYIFNTLCHYYACATHKRQPPFEPIIISNQKPIRDNLIVIFLLFIFLLKYILTRSCLLCLLEQAVHTNKNLWYEILERNHRYRL